MRFMTVVLLGLLTGFSVHATEIIGILRGDQGELTAPVEASITCMQIKTRESYTFKAKVGPMSRDAGVDLFVSKVEVVSTQIGTGVLGHNNVVSLRSDVLDGDDKLCRIDLTQSVFSGFDFKDLKIPRLERFNR